MNCWGRKTVGLLGLAGALAMGGCGLWRPVEDPTRFYLLDLPIYNPVSGQEDTLVLGVNRAQVARYLDTPGLTVREGENRVFNSQRHRWAEALEHGIPRLLAETLRQEQVVEEVILDAAHRRQLPDYDLQIRLFRAEGDRVRPEQPRAVFDASWELRTGPDGEVVARGRVVEGDLPWDGQNFDLLVASLSAGVVNISHEVALALEDLRQ